MSAESLQQGAGQEQGDGDQCQIWNKRSITGTKIERLVSMFFLIFYVPIIQFFLPFFFCLFLTLDIFYEEFYW